MSPRSNPPPASVPSAKASAAAFIDGIESGVARILLEDPAGEWRPYHLPASLLPKDAREGGWLRLTAESIPPPAGADTARLRSHLGRSDPGGDIHL